MNQMINTTRTITTSPGAAIGRDGESLPRKAHIEQPRDMGEVMASIQGLARRIHDETGRYVAYTEDMHSTSNDVSVWIQHEGGATAEFDAFRGSDRPIDGYSTTHEQMRDELASWLADYRKEQEAA